MFSDDGYLSIFFSGRNLKHMPWLNSESRSDSRNDRRSRTVSFKDDVPMKWLSGFTSIATCNEPVSMDGTHGEFEEITR